MYYRPASLLLACLLLLHSNISSAKLESQQAPVQLAIVLDDLGYSENDLHALSLPSEITFALLPFTPYAKKIAKLAQQQNRELLLHMPMQAKLHNEKLGKGALMLDMPESVFKARLLTALRYFPSATAMNNHMGSSLTEHIEPMKWIMDVLQQQGLYFLDSRTSAQTVAQSSAQIAGIPALRRHIFLDNIKTPQAMKAQLEQALEIGQQHPVIIIAHPYPETLLFIKENLIQNKQHITLIPLHQLLATSDRLALAQKRSKWQQANNMTTNQNQKTQ